MKNSTSNSLFSDLKKGSSHAFEKVYLDNRSRFLNFAKKYGLREVEILDIYQDTYIILYENITTGKLVDLKSSVTTYLFSIGKYKILEHLRKKEKNVSDHKTIFSIDVNEQIEHFDIINDEEQSLEQKVLSSSFDKLGEKCKNILTMFYYKKYKLEKIMKEGNYNSINVVKSQKSRCLKTLKELCSTFSN